MKTGDVISLRGRTLKGKNRVREHGQRWTIVKVSGGTEFIDKGMVYIEPVLRRGRWPESRWIHPTTDPDFEIIEKVMVRERSSPAA